MILNMDDIDSYGKLMLFKCEKCGKEFTRTGLTKHHGMVHK